MESWFVQNVNPILLDVMEARCGRGHMGWL
jgi:hypothetical protein